MIWLILIILFIVFLFIYFKWFKNFDVPCVSLFTGAPKTGKTLCSVSCAYRLHRRKLFVYRLKKYVLSYLFFWKYKQFKNLEKLLLYSNIALNVKGGYVPLTRDLLLRQKRFAYGSTILISECALVADSMAYKDTLINETLTLFNKLIGHETKGGHLIYDTQSLYDCHYAIKRVCSNYYYIVKQFKWLPFIHLVKCKKLEYNPDIENVVVNEDAEDTAYWYILSKKTYKRYDRYCYSVFTDYLNVVDNVILKPKTTKQDTILQIREFDSLKKGNLKNEK